MTQGDDWESIARDIVTARGLIMDALPTAHRTHILADYLYSELHSSYTLRQVPADPLPPWIDQQEWDRDLAKVAAQWLGFMSIFNRDQPDGLTKKEMRNVLRSMSDDTRNRFIFWLGQVGKGNDDGWNKFVVPFMNEVWPRERVYRTATSTNSWIGLLDDTGQSFPAVYASVKQFLVPVETDQHPFYRFTRELDNETPLTARFPEATLDLVNTVTPVALARPSYELPKILAIVRETAPELMANHRYLRLIDLVERS